MLSLFNIGAVTKNSCDQPTKMTTENTTIARINDNTSLESIEGETLIDSRSGLRPQQTVIYRLEPEIGQWQEKGDQQSVDQPREEECRAERGKGKKECKIREEQEKIDKFMAAMAQLAQTQQQMLQQKTSQRTRVDVAIYQEVKTLTVF